MYLIAFIIFILGLGVGSFLNVIIFRLHLKMKITGRSLCLSCKNKIAWYDNIPVLSYIILRRKCRSCKVIISWQYPVIELATAIAFLLGYWQFGLGLKLYTFFVFTAVLIIVFTYDLKHYLILDIVTIPAMIFSFIVNMILGTSPVDLIIGAVALSAFFWFQYVVSRGKWIGGGDIYLGAVMGFMLGWKLGVTALFLAYLIGAVVALILLALKKKQIGSEVPFGTFLSLATIIILLYGEQILNWYLASIIY